MIFVTVGTHEQPFDRLIEHIDSLVKNNIIVEEVIMQSGYSKYEPQFCKWKKWFSYSEMIELVSKANIVITHGGPSSFIMPLQVGKIPIVVPRQLKYHEHVNNHQVEFSKAVAERQRNIIVVEEMEKMEYYIRNYNSIIKEMTFENESTNLNFNKKLENIVSELFRK